MPLRLKEEAWFELRHTVRPRMDLPRQALTAAVVAPSSGA